ncbi:hypothetical protein J6590_060970 [Homalodisca vitripennis]|nr:hypothetical protein J6590_060970 [Homalodisca vitripennis]
MSLGEFFSSQKAFEIPGARSVLITVAKEVFINDLLRHGEGPEQPLPNSNHLLVSSTSPTEP